MLCCAIDNNLTRKVSASDPLQIAEIRAWWGGQPDDRLGDRIVLPDARTVLTAGLVGFCGYGLSLVMDVLARRHLGTAHTGEHFSNATFVGLAISLVMLGDAPGPLFWTAALLMGGRVWLHLT